MNDYGEQQTVFCLSGQLDIVMNGSRVFKCVCVMIACFLFFLLVIANSSKFRLQFFSCMAPFENICFRFWFTIEFIFNNGQQWNAPVNVFVYKIDKFGMLTTFNASCRAYGARVMWIFSHSNIQSEVLFFHPFQRDLHANLWTCSSTFAKFWFLSFCLHSAKVFFSYRNFRLIIVYKIEDSNKL